MPEELKKEKKESIGLRVDKSAIDNCSSIANDLKWSFNQVVEAAMKRIKKEDLINEMISPKQL